MRYGLIMISCLLAGCSLTSAGWGPRSLLDTAPKTNEELRYPDWGGVTAKAPAVEKVRPPVKKTRQLSEIETFLRNNNIRYRMIPGNYTVYHLQKDVHFHTGSALVSYSSYYWLDSLAHYLITRPDIVVVINGHADNTGTEVWNESLSELRAEQVKLRLLAAALPATQVYTRGYSDYLPECSNGSANGKACNRRVEITLIAEKK